MTNPAHFTTHGLPIWGRATTEEHVQHQTQQELNQCRHFTGIQHETCAAGVAYWAIGPQPCVKKNASPHVCALRSFPTDAEARVQAEERIAHIAASMQEMDDRFANQLCLHCGEAWTSRREIGPCVYAYPCGHRQFQGRLP